MTSAPGVTSPEPPVIGPATREDLPAVYALLAAAKLPPDGLDEHVGGLLVARDGGTVVGSATVEVHGRGALLRSVVVAPARRGERLGHRLTNAALELAWARGVERVYLLTETASAFFARRGFREIQRAQVEPAVTRSREFHGICPASATVMVLERARAP
jgi:amino-acid N-acetyltransferase